MLHVYATQHASRDWITRRTLIKVWGKYEVKLLFFLNPMSAFNIVAIVVN